MQDDHTASGGPGQEGAAEPPALNSIGGSKYSRDGGAWVVGEAVDTLYHNYSIDGGVLDAFRPDFEEWKQVAQESEEQVYRVPDSEWFMAAKGRSHYQYVLTWPGRGELMLTYNPIFRQKSGARVRLFAPYLAGFADYGQQAAAAFDLVAFFFGPDNVHAVQVSEIHVAADLAGWVPRLSDWLEQRFACPARPHLEEADLEAGVIQSMRWGKHGSPVSAVLYNKTKEIREQSTHKGYLLDGYRERGWSEADGDVYRLEFRFSREWLRECGVNSPADVDVAALFLAGMQWLTLRQPVAGDSNRSRWPVAALWLQIQEQGAALLGEAWRQYERAYVPRVDVGQLVNQVVGCMACLGALVDSYGLHNVFGRLMEEAEEAIQRRRLNFAEMVARRRDRYLLPAVGGS